MDFHLPKSSYLYKKPPVINYQFRIIMRTLSRKEFLQLALTSSIAIPLMGYGYAGRGSKEQSKSHPDDASPTFFDELGFQVFTLRDLLVDNAHSLFEALAGAGIKNIEFFDPLTLNEYVPIVKDYGMHPLATHFMPGYVTGNWESARAFGMEPREDYHFENIVEDCVANGIKYAGIAILMAEDRTSLDDYKVFAEKANTCGEISKKAGVQLYYHNHNFEFEPVDGTTPYAEMLKIFDRDLVKLELDVFWTTVAGQDPVQWLREIADWMLFLHLKDLTKGFQVNQYTVQIPEDSFTELGTGMLDLKKILTIAREKGISYAIIDQDHTQMEDKIASVQKNCDFIETLGI